MTTFFTADHHFSHAKIIEYCNRPFTDLPNMNWTMINEWNEMVGGNDVVYHLGDFTLGNADVARRYFLHLNGRIRILANPWHHDRRWLPTEFGVSAFLSASGRSVEICPPMVVLEFPEIKVGKRPQVVVLCHYPLAEWDRKHYGSWHLHGHSHERLTAPGLIMDVGVDNQQFRPVSLETVKAHMTFISGR